MTRFDVCRKSSTIDLTPLQCGDGANVLGLGPLTLVFFKEECSANSWLGIPSSQEAAPCSRRDFTQSINTARDLGLRTHAAIAIAPRKI